MWIMLNDAFFSIVHKHCSPDQLLVRARRPGDIEKVFGRRVVVTRDTKADYLFRAVIAREDVATILCRELERVTYPNFKNSVRDRALHAAYAGVWIEMSNVQDPPPYSDAPRYEDELFVSPKLTDTFHSEAKRPVSRKKKGAKP